MRMTLEAMAGLLVGRKFDVGPGRPFVFGRSERATVCHPHDPDLAPVHLEVVCEGEEVRVRALTPGSPVYVDGKRISEALLRPDGRIVAGRTTLVARLLEEQSEPPPPAEERTGPELLAWLETEERLQRLAAPGETGRELVATLVDENEPLAAIPVMAWVLGARKAVWWGCVSVEDDYGGSVPATEAATFEAARAWVANPSEALRQQAGRAVDLAGHRGICAWLALAASWSGAGAASPDEDPDERLPGRALTAGLRLAAARRHGSENLRYRHFLALAAEVDEGRRPFPAAPIRTNP